STNVFLRLLGLLWLLWVSHSVRFLWCIISLRLLWLLSLSLNISITGWCRIIWLQVTSNLVISPIITILVCVIMLGDFCFSTSANNSIPVRVEDLPCYDWLTD